jgi:class 3 adenylate cyclase
MPVFMDIHDLHGADAKSIAEAHAADIATQSRYGVEYIKYWFNENTGKVFCLCTAPSADAARCVHEKAHGFVAEEIIEVEPHVAEALLGGGGISPNGRALLADGKEVDTAIRTIMFTDIVDSTSVTQHIGDHAALELVGFHDTVVRNAIALNDGREVKHTGDGIMASFTSSDSAVRAAMRVQEEVARSKFERGGIRLRVRIGAAAGEPVERRNDLFGSTVQLAARLCSAAQPEEILVSQSVLEACAGHHLPFHDLERIRLKGFDEPQIAASVDWHSVAAVA